MLPIYINYRFLSTKGKLLPFFFFLFFHFFPPNPAKITRDICNIALGKSEGEKKVLREVPDFTVLLSVFSNQEEMGQELPQFLHKSCFQFGGGWMQKN